jgi:hypothetical protein
MHKTFKIQTEMQFGQNKKKTKKSHNGVKTKVVQIVSKNPINTRLTLEFNKWTKQKPMSIKITKRHMFKDISHFKYKNKWKRNEISNSQREQGSTNKPNSPHILLWHAKYQKEKIFLPTTTNTNWNKHKDCVIMNIGEVPQD